LCPGSTPAEAKTGLAVKDRLGSISKQGDRYIRGLFVAGALAVIRYAKIHGTKHRPCALANKIARMAWAMMARGEHYNEPVALAR
jgi:transposase